VFLRINGVLHYLWRAVDQNGVVLDILVQARRNATAAKHFFKRLLAGLNQAFPSAASYTDSMAAPLARDAGRA
jgi:transposase-like protein